MTPFYGHAGHCTQNSVQPRKKSVKKFEQHEAKGKKHRGSDLKNKTKKIIIKKVHTVERELLRVELVEKPSDWRENSSHCITDQTSEKPICYC